MMKTLLAFMLTLSSSLALASFECDFDLQIHNAVIQITNNSQLVEHPVLIKRGITNPSECQNYRIYFSKGFANNYQRRAFTGFGQHSIPYNLHKNSNQSGILKERNDAVTGNEYLNGSLPERNRFFENRLYISAPGLYNTSSVVGYYFDVIQASAYSLGNGNWHFQRTQNFTVIFYVSQLIRISITDEGGTFQSGSSSKVLDFGHLTQNAEKGADVRVVSNGSYQLKISSQNNGVLKHTQNGSIAYALRVNGAQVNLSSSKTSPVSIGSGNATSSSGDLYNLKVKIIENTQNKPAGFYKDIVTITAIAN